MTDSNCLFCKIIAGEIPSTKVYENEYVYAFKDINPQAPVHILVIPREHITSAAVINSDNSVWVSRCYEAIAEIAKQENLVGGFRVVSNAGADAGQTVFHLHFHILAGERLSDHMA